MTITLYWTLMSQPSRAVKCLLEIGKIPHELKEINLLGNQTRSKQYLAINPLGQIPFLIDGSFKIGESSAILLYLCEKYPKQLQGYYGINPKERGLINQYLSTYQSIYRPALFKIIYLKIYKGLKQKKAIKQIQLDRAEAEMIQALESFEEMLKHSKTPFLIGERPTIADLLYFFQTTNMILFEKKFDGLTFISSWYNRMGQIQAVRQITQKWKEIAPALTETFKTLGTNNSKL